MRVWLAKCVTLIFVCSPILASDLESILGGQSAAKEQDQNVFAQQDLLAETLRSQMAEMPTPEQNIFLINLQNQKYQDALVQMGAAFGQDASAMNQNLQAVRSYLLYKVGLRLSGIESLFAISEPNKVHFYILNRWKETLPAHNDPIWGVANITWAPTWTALLGTSFEARVRLAQVTARANLETLNELAPKVSEGSQERALINWYQALNLIGQDNNQEAAKLIAILLKLPQAPVNADLMNMTAARMLYQAGLFEGAIGYYKKVPKTSDFWILAQEEMAWSFLRKGEPQNAVATGETLTLPAFRGWAGPEAYLVTAIAGLRICDYPKVVDTLAKFSDQFKKRVEILNALAKQPDQSSDLDKVLKDLAQMEGPMTITQVGTKLHRVPAMVLRDRMLRELLKGEVTLAQEFTSAESLYARSLALTGLQAQFEMMKKQIGLRKTAMRSQVLARVEALAKNEAYDIGQVLAKMHIIEAEVLTHVTLADRLLSDSNRAPGSVDIKKGSTGSQAKGAMKFSKSSELWFDEIGNLKVDVKKACQATSTIQ